MSSIQIHRIILEELSIIIMNISLLEISQSPSLCSGEAGGRHEQHGLQTHPVPGNADIDVKLQDP